jgi:hypothetical protein
MKKPAKLSLHTENIQVLIPTQLAIVAGGGRDPKPTPSTKVSCASAACNTH